MITIDNGQYRAAISPRGAELKSFKNLSTGQELIWEADPEVWGGSAPILFPIVGALCNGQTSINGQPYPLPKHGLVRTMNAEVTSQDKDYAVFTFSSNEETLKLYPYSFCLEVEFRLAKNQLKVSYRVLNSGKEEMLFTIGSHPAFALDLEEAALEAYYIEFSEPENLDLFGLTNGLLAKKANDYLVNAARIPLSESLFSDDALIFKEIVSKSIRLKSKQTSHYIEVKLHGSPHLGLWSKPGAPYVCIEPWFSFDDTPECDGQFENKPGIMKLAPDETFKTAYTICVMAD